MGAAAIFCISYITAPMMAWAVINQNWQFHVPIIDVMYKPWRLYFIICSSPEIIAALVLLFVPESPKFVLGQGHKMEAYKILEKINRWNNGQKSTLELFEIVEENESIENRQRILDCKQSRFPLLKSIWIQTAPLFKPPHFYSIVLVCTIQFCTYITCNGLFMFFAQIINKMATSLDSFVDERMMMCDIINMKPSNTSGLNFDEIETKVSFRSFFEASNNQIHYRTISNQINILWTFFYYWQIGLRHQIRVGDIRARSYFGNCICIWSNCVRLIIE